MADETLGLAAAYRAAADLLTLVENQGVTVDDATIDGLPDHDEHDVRATLVVDLDGTEAMARTDEHGEETAPAEQYVPADPVPDATDAGDDPAPDPDGADDAGEDGESTPGATDAGEGPAPDPDGADANEDDEDDATDAGGVECEECRETFDTERAKNIHAGHQHGDDDEEEIADDGKYCGVCGYGPKSQRAVKVHHTNTSREGHAGDPDVVDEPPESSPAPDDDEPDPAGDDEAAVYCGICGEGYPSTEEFRDHHDGTHDGEPVPLDEAPDEADLVDGGDPTRADGTEEAVSDGGVATATADSSPPEDRTLPAVIESPDSDASVEVPDRLSVEEIEQAVAQSETLAGVADTIDWPKPKVRVLLAETGHYDDLVSPEGQPDWDQGRDG